MQPEPDSAELRVDVYDTTLRDGTQREGLWLSLDDKLRIACRLDELGVAFIEAGWPGANPKDNELFRRAKDMHWKNALLSAFGATRRVGIAVEEDPGLAAVLDAGTPVVTLFGKSSPMHVTQVLRTNLEENLKMIEQSVAYLRAEGRRVVYDAEHFFDAYAQDASYAIETLNAAARGGAEVLVLCDTNGGSTPWWVAEVVRVAARTNIRLGIHTHNDSECAVANALTAVRAGATHVQGTINGYGERCGNANLCSVVADLELKLNARCLPPGHLNQLYDVAHFVAEVANLSADEHLAYVGRSAFAHKGGVHVAAMQRNARAYEHIEPALVGNRTRIVVSELAGKATVQGKAEQLGIALTHDVAQSVLEEIKAAEARGFSYEAAEASVALKLRRTVPGYQPPFRLIDYRIIAGQQGDASAFSEATVKLAVGDEVLFTAACGNGPVSAHDAALRKALLPLFPAVGRIRLVDYKVRILDSARGTSAQVRVLIDSTDGVLKWSTVGAAASILAASWQALAESVEYGLLVSEQSPAVASLVAPRPSPQKELS